MAKTKAAQANPNPYPYRNPNIYPNPNPNSNPRTKPKTNERPIFLRKQKQALNLTPTLNLNPKIPKLSGLGFKVQD